MRRSLLLCALLLAVPPGIAHAAVAAQPIFHDPLTGTPGQHATAVEPDSFAFGTTVVAAFQVGRTTTGGAAAIGWATSTDGGRAWRSGLLPGLTPYAAVAGPYSRVSDPAVAYDRVHGVWLISVLALRDTPGRDAESALVVSRSPDGLSWNPPVTTSPPSGSFAHDKNWIACDNGTSRFAGRCYTTWTDPTRRSATALSASADGGLTWGARVLASGSENGTGSQPLVRPDGTVVVPYLDWRGALAVTRSRDGGATLDAPVRAAFVRSSPPAGLRAPPLPSAEIDAAGRIYVAWHDCRFRSTCPSGSNDVVLVSSPDGVRWTRPARVPLSPLDGPGTHVLPGLGVDSTTGGPSARLALVYYTLSPAGATAGFVSSRDGGRTWSRPLTLGPRFALEWIPETSGGRMLGDYTSTSFVAGGVAVPVFAAPTAPFDGSFHQPIFAAAVAPLAPAALRVASFAAAPTPPRAGRSFTAVLRLDAVPPGARVGCTLRVGGRRLGPARRALRAGSAACTWALPARAVGTSLRGSIFVRAGASSVRRAFSFRVRAPR